MRSLLLLTLLAACSAPTQTGPAATPTQTGTGGTTAVETPSTTPAPAAGPGVGEPCASDHTCGDGLVCVGYYGIAGPRGPKFESCEKRCDGKSACPEGRTCTTIADGPGQVCR